MEIDPLIGQQLGAYTIQSKLGEEAWHASTKATTHACGVR